MSEETSNETTSAEAAVPEGTSPHAVTHIEDPALRAAPPAEGGAAPAEGEGTPAEGESAEGAPAPAKPAGKTWYQKRIERLTAEKHALAAQLATAKPEAGNMASVAATPPAAGDEVPTVEQFASAVQNTAAALRAHERFEERGAAVSAKGREAHEDFFDACAEMKNLWDLQDPKENAAYVAFVDAAMDIGGDAAHELLYGLAQDLDEVERLKSLPATKLAIELVKRNGKVAAAAPVKPAAPGSQVSKAPAPITPVTARGHQEIRPDDPQRAHMLPTDDWMARRQAEVAEKRKAGVRIR